MIGERQMFCGVRVTSVYAPCPVSVCSVSSCVCPECWLEMTLRLGGVGWRGRNFRGLKWALLCSAACVYGMTQFPQKLLKIA